MRSRMLAAVALITTAALAACDAGGATGPRDEGQLTAGQAAWLNRAMFTTAAGFAGGQVPGGTRGVRRTSTAGNGTFSVTFNTTHPCTPSGNVALAGTLGGTVDAVARTGSVQANVGVQHQGCTIKTDDGATFTVNGDPDIDVALNAASGPNGLTAFTLTQTGAFTWSRTGASGRCDVNVSASLVAGTQNVQLSGTFCGFPVSGTVPAS
ncbi:MAG TPA: hypothetical protein VFS20_25130 [Longimicrobium sp.]|nr:hypothetical protein [Longimicrobium sp.]